MRSGEKPFTSNGDLGSIVVGYTQSTNLGEIDIEALIAGQPQERVTNPDGTFQLFRVGDAVASRNIHAAIYDSLRLCKAF